MPCLAIARVSIEKLPRQSHLSLTHPDEVVSSGVSAQHNGRSPTHWRVGV